MEYKILEENTCCSLESAVERLLRNGWKLQGGVSVVCQGYRLIFYQAMVKENTN